MARDVNIATFEAAGTCILRSVRGEPGEALVQWIGIRWKGRAGGVGGIARNVRKGIYSLCDARGHA